jgi:hypothetical protein
MCVLGTKRISGILDLGTIFGLELVGLAFFFSIFPRRKLEFGSKDLTIRSIFYFQTISLQQGHSGTKNPDLGGSALMGY